MSARTMSEEEIGDRSHLLSTWVDSEREHKDAGIEEAGEVEVVKHMSIYMRAKQYTSNNLNRVASWAAVVAILVFGLGLGFLYPARHNLPSKYARFSAILGWTYFTAWSVSFYPQIYLNWSRKSVVGLSFDYELYNIIGYLSYTAFNVSFYWIPSLQHEYQRRHDGNNSGVRASDVFFTLHAVVFTIITIIQIFIYDKGDQKLSKVSIYSSIVWTILTAAFIILIITQAVAFFSYYNFMYYLSYTKLVVSFVKYCPQVYLNYSYRSTEGWNIGNVLLDFLGGFLSVAQLVLDAAVTNDWSKLSGDPVKLGLGSLSMVFDVIFMIQHYCLYPNHKLDSEKPDMATGPKTKYSTLASEGPVSINSSGDKTEA